MRIIFAGTPVFALPSLEAVIRSGRPPVAVLTQPDRPAGRGRRLSPSPVKQRAAALGLLVRQPASLRDPAAVAELAALEPELIVVVAYGLLLPPQVLALPPRGCINVHASLLPRWRGAAPIQRAVIAGDRETGMMMMKMDEGLDTGSVALAERVAIGPFETSGELHDRLMQVGARLMVAALEKLETGTLALTPQSAESVIYAKKIDKAETRIDWKRAAPQVHNHIRGLSPFPGAWCEASLGGKSERLKILRSTPSNATGGPGEILDDRLTVGCAEGAVRLTELQRAGGRAVTTEEFLRGIRIEKGMRLS